MKPLVIYHDNCADGFGAAFAAWLKLGDGAEYVPAQYGDKNWVLPPLRDRDVYILDFSFTRETMKYFFEDAKRVVWRDHHKTAFEMWCGKYEKGLEHDQIGDFGSSEIDVFLDDNKSGAYLAWEFFHPGTEVPMLIEHIDDYDRWQFKIEGTKAFQKALWSYAPWSFEQWEGFFISGSWSVDLDNIDAFINEGEAILRAHDQNVQSVVKESARGCAITIAEWSIWPSPFEAPGLAANCPPFLTSDVGHELATQSGTFGLCWTLSKTGLIAQCSLRSNGDYDVSAIAKAFGGGGHFSAGGFEVPITTLLGWLK